MASVFAVCVLMTISNLVARITGRSAGFSPSGADRHPRSTAQREATGDRGATLPIPAPRNRGAGSINRKQPLSDSQAFWLTVEDGNRILRWSGARAESRPARGPLPRHERQFSASVAPVDNVLAALVP